MASFLGIDLANRNARQAFELSMRAVSGRATHQVLGPPEGIPEEVYVRLKEQNVTAAPVVDGYFMLHVPNQDLQQRNIPAPGRTFRLLGVDVLAEEPFRPYVADDDSSPPLGPFLTQPNTVLMSRRVATELGLEPGSKFHARIGTRTEELTLLGTLDPKDELSQRALESVLVADIATAQELLDRPGRLSRIDLVLTEPIPLPSNLRLAPAAQRDQALGSMSAAFHLNLTALSLLSLIVGMFLIYQTASFTVVQRRELWGRLRTLGVTKRELIELVLAEALLLGTLGSALGLLLGVALSRGLLTLITRTLNDLYFVVNVESVTLEPISLVTALAIGVAATALAALAPAREAADSPAGFVLQRSQAEESARRTTQTMAWIGLAAAAAGTLLLALPTRSVPVGLLGMFGQLVGLAATAPAAALLLTRLVWRPLRKAPLTVRLGIRSVTGSLSRTAVALAALTLAVSATVGIGVMVDSFRGTLVRWLEVTLQEDVFLAPPTVISGRNLSTLDPALIPKLRALKNVKEVSLLRGVQVDARTPDATTPVRLEAADPNPASFHFREQAPDLWQRYEEGQVLVSEPFAFRHKLHARDSLELLTQDGFRSFPIAGIFTDYSATDGIVMLDRDDYVRIFRDEKITAAALTVEGDPDAVVKQVRELDPGLLVRSNRALREASLEVFERTFAVTGVLRAVATVVAFLGMLSSLIALELERSKQSAILRALGMTCGQITRMGLWQSAWMGLSAGLLALPLGVIQALGMIYVINRRSFGWTLELDLDPRLLLEALALALAAALLAAALTQRRASPAQALREE